MNLVIVESAAKAKTIEKYLGKIHELKQLGDFKVVACFGHVRDLPSKTLGVDTTTWNVDYETLEKKRDVVSRIRQAAKGAKKVYLASDPDREGAAIAYHLRELLGLKRAQYDRVVFHEITQSGIRRAFLHPADINMDEFHSQEARRILDRVVGYVLSPMLWRRFAKSNLSAGRVQSAALKILVDRAKDIEQHVPEPYWICAANFVTKDNIDLPSKAFSNGALAAWDDKNDVQMALREFGAESNWMASFCKKRVRKNPPPPFTTSSLQQEAYKTHGIPSKRTMQLAQQLYEAGLITYMRTDSTTLSKEAQNKMLAWIEEAYGADKAAPRQYSIHSAHAQEAHECIRPTNMHMYGSALDANAFSPSHKKLYDLVWKRAVASQMAAAEYAMVEYEVGRPNKTYDVVFKGFFKVLTEPGYLVMYKTNEEDSDACAASLDAWDTYLCCKAPCNVALKELQGCGDVKRPKPAFNEPSLIKMMEKAGIGRPSTYATIIDKLLDKKYSVKGSVATYKINVTHFKWHPTSTRIEQTEDTVVIGNTEKDRMLPTSLGTDVASYLESVVPFLLDVGFTADMEKDLDLILSRTRKKSDVLGTFYSRFQPAVEKAQRQLEAKRQEQRAAGSHKSKTNNNGQLQPSKIVRSYKTADIVETRYGHALFIRSEQRFISLGAFMDWRGKTVEDMTDRDVMFLLSLPFRPEGTTRCVCYGQYGLYVKEGDNTNIPMFDKSMWEAAYNGTLTAEAINGLTKKYTKKRHS